MIEKEIIYWISDNKKISNISLVEKDLYLQLILIKLVQNNYFNKNFVFKGGTCLTKAYLGYYRFSEDLDFTWINTKEFDNKSNKQIRKNLSKEINNCIQLLKKISIEIGLEFETNKSNENYIQLGGSNKFVTFKLWYNSINFQKSFIKIQINFVEKILFPIKKQEIKAIVQENKKEIEFLFPKSAELITKTIKINCYSLKEIAVEKVRALLTRKGFKSRDIIDLYELSKQNIHLKDIRKKVIEKTLFMLDFSKYQENLNNKNFEKFVIGNEQTLLLKPIEKDFNVFANKTIKELNELVNDIRELKKEGRK
jgi:predicted nucleotidyltransferase component of viral defense system